MNLKILVFGLLSFLLSTCQNNTDNTTAEAQTQEKEDSLPTDYLNNDERLPGISAVAWNELQALIPNTAAGMPRTNIGEDRSDLGDRGFSHALGAYEKDGRRINVQFLDCGSQETILLAVAPWLGRAVDAEYDVGSEKGTTVKGYPAFEQTDKTENTCGLSTVIKDRFVVIVSGTNVSLEMLREVMDGLDLGQLGNMK